MVEEPQVGVDQGDGLLVTGIDHNLVSSRARWSCDVLNAALQTDTEEGNESKDGWQARQYTTVCRSNGFQNRSDSWCVKGACRPFPCNFYGVYGINRCFCERCVIFTRLARSMLSLKGKKASELTATACRELIQFFFSVSDRSSGTSSYFDFQTAKSGPCRHKIHTIQDVSLIWHILW